MIYTENFEIGTPYREKQLLQIQSLIAKKRKEAKKEASKIFNPDFSSIKDYNQSVESHRRKFMGMLGWPLNTFVPDIPRAQMSFVAEDELGSIFRVEIDVMDEMTAYGILFLPKGTGPFPTVICQHGGDGTPEVCSGFIDGNSFNYNDMTQRMRKRGFLVFAPQLLLWENQYGPEINRIHIDNQLKQLGGSITALELFKLRRIIDWLYTRSEVDTNRLGMVGLSYGGFYTLYLSAVDTRIKAALSSCFFNDRFVYDWSDWTWFDSAHGFLDAEICGLICPRALYVEVGNKDSLFNVSYTIEESKRARKYYEQLKIPESFIFNEFDGEHEFNKSDNGIDFICKQLL